MADSKVSELTSATSVGGSDVFYLVQSSTSKKVTAATLFENVSNVTLKGNVLLDSTVQTLSSPGVINLNRIVTHLSSDASGGSLTIGAGNASQLKIICMTATSGGAYTLSSNIAGNAVITFDTVGDTATLLYTNSKWFVVGGTANVTY